MAHTLLRVAIPRPLFRFYDYYYEGEGIPQIGSRVRIDFGHTEMTGLIIELPKTSSVEELKPVLKLLDKVPLINAATLKFLRWAANYYHHPLGEVIQNALPVALRATRQIPTSLKWHITQTDQSETLKNAPKQQALYEFLCEEAVGIKEEVLKQKLGTSYKNTLKQLSKKALIASEICEAEFIMPTTMLDNATARLQLTKEQSDCVEQIKGIANSDSPMPVLLHGITGSGKTEIYLHAIEPTLEEAKQVLILVPEIGLTPQLTQRFQYFFPKAKIVLLHSKLANIERMNAWLAAQTGQADIIIGTRSAVFTPIPRLGQIIIDEEHDASLKQQEGFRYHARDLAIKRAHDQKIPIIIGSATPSLESYYNVQSGRYHYLLLKKRPGARVQPEVLLQDVRGLPLEAGLSPPLIKAIKAHLEAGNQAMVFLNRRGFAPALYCPQCGWHAQCKSCDANMTYHAHKQKVICHHCDYEETVKPACPDCGNTHISTKGQGTERLEHTLQTQLPNSHIVRIDRDTTQQKHALTEKLKVVNAGDPVLLIGTQMLAKGHDFPNLTLVGILDVDQSLFSTDFRAWEKLAQLVIQVSGRAGRAEKKGTVILQTSQPEHPFFHTLLTGGYLAIANQSLQERKNWHFPPYAHQMLIRANAAKQEHASNFLQDLKDSIAEHASTDCILLGPAPSPMEKRNNRYRFQLLITAKSRKQLHQMAQEMTINSENIKKRGGLRWSIDIDPIDYS